MGAIVTRSTFTLEYLAVDQMCIVPIRTSKPGLGIGARTSIANESHMVSTKTAHGLVRIYTKLLYICGLNSS